MQFLLKTAFYSIVYLCISINLSFASTLTDKETRGLQALEDIQFTITSLAERVTPMVVNITPIREITSPQGFKRKGSYVQGSGSGVFTHDMIIGHNNAIVPDNDS